MTVKADTRLRRLPEKGSRDFNLACAIIDTAHICHVGFALEKQPYVLPMAMARDDKNLLLHGSTASRLMKNLADGLACCVTVTHLDGLVLARSAFHSSMHYRCVMVFGTARPITDTALKSRALDLLTDHLLPGRRADIRASTRKELNATAVLSLPIEQYSVKTGSGPPDDPASDVKAPIWAGVVPLSLQAGTPIPAPDMDAGIPVPAYLQALD